MNDNIFERMNKWVNSVESSVVNLLTALAPWLAPLIPAYMTFQHMKDFLFFPDWIAWIAAAIVEILGFSTVSTFLEFWFYNRRERSGKAKAPVEIIIGVFIFYLFLIIVSNVVIDVSIAFLSVEWQKLAVVIVRFLLTCQTIPAVFIVATRTGHKNLLEDIKKEKDEAKQAKQERKQGVMESSQKVPNLSNSEEEVSKKPDDWRKVRPTLTLDQLKELANLKPDQIRNYAEKIGYTYKTLSNWRMRARAELNIQDEEIIEEQPQQNTESTDSDGW